MTNDRQPMTRLSRLAWLPVPFFLTAMVVLWAADLRTAHESQFLLALFNGLFSTLAALLVTILVGHCYLERGSPGLLLLGCGVAIWGAAGTLVPVLFPYGTNALIGGHNSLIWFSALFQLAGVLLSAGHWRTPRLVGLTLTAAYSGTVCLVWLVVMLVEQGLMPMFFLQGRGGTPLRAIVLGSSVAMFALTAVVLWRTNRPSPSAFVRWYGAALLLVATGLLGIMLESVHGGALSWTGRSAQFLGGAYMLAAAIASVREAPGGHLSLVAALRASDERYKSFAAATFEGIVESEAGIIMDCNEQFARMMGYTVAELKGMAIAHLIAPDDRDRVAANIGGNSETVIEHAVLHKDGTRIIVEAHGRPVAPGSPLRYTAIRDITARKHAEQQLRELTQRLTYHVDNSPLAVIEWGRDMRLTRWSGAAERIFGWTAEEVLGKRMEDFRWIYPEDQPQVAEVSHELKTGANPSRFSANRNYRKDGTVIHCEWYNSSLVDEAGSLHSILSLVLDVTARKQAEAALKESEDRFRTMANAMPQLAWIARPDGHLVWYNQRWFQYTGTTPEQMEGWGWQSVHDPVELPKVMECWKSSIATGEPFEMTFPLRSAAGVYRLFLTRGFPLKDAAGRVVQWFGTNTDVTELKRAEEALRESEKRLRLAQDVAGIGIWEWIPASGKTTWSPEIERIYGVAPGVLSDYQTWRKCVYPEDIARIEAETADAITNRRRFEMEFRIIRPSGDLRWVATLGGAIVDDSGEVVRAYGVNMDITERKQAEEALAAAHRQLQSVIDNTPSLVYAFDLDERFLMANATIAKLLNSTPARMMGKRRHDFMPQADADWHEANDRKVIEAGRELEFEEKSELPGHPITWLTTKFPLRDAQGRIYAVAGISTDITGRKRAELARRQRVEDALHLSEQEFHFLAESVPQIVWATRSDGWNIYFNQQWVDYTGMTMEESYGHGWNKPFHPDDKQRAWEAWQRATQHSERYSLECRLRRHDGVYRWWLIRGEPMRGANGEILKWFGTCTDIEELKRAEAVLHEANDLLEQRVAERTAALRASEERHRLLAETMVQGVVHQDATGSIIEMNPAAEQILGKTHEQFLGSSSVKEEHDTIRENGEPFPGMEHPSMVALRTGLPVHGVVMGVFNPRCGERRWISIDAVPAFRAGETQPAEVYTVFADITERKQVEEALRASLHEKEVLLKEVHHRVKNNMQVLASLVSLQTDAVDDVATRDHFNDFRDQIRTMALVHENLYQSETLANINFAEYVCALTAGLSRTHGRGNSDIRLTLDVEPVSLPIESAVPCGLILNELVTNVYKHAFRDRTSGEIVVRLRADSAGRVCLGVCDNGVGLPSDLDWRQSPSLGLSLVQMLARQIRAELDICSENGIAVQLTFTPSTHGVPKGESHA